jgi:ABC-2 type transport system permease protein
MDSLRWIPHVLSIELKKAINYRAAFWIQFLLGTATEIGVAYFLWAAIYEARGAAEIEGFNFNAIVYYYLFASFSQKIGRGSDHGYLAQDIYDGGLTRYLVYPIPFFGFKYITHISQQLLGIIQLTLAFTALRFLMGPAEGSQLTLQSYLAGAATCLIAGYLYFVLISCLELVAFWQDVIWNLVAMLRFTMALLGGAMIPLAFFPEWGRQVVQFTPFPTMIAFPARTFLGQVGWQEWIHNVGLLAAWSLIFTMLAAFIWSRGTRKYTGVGM